MTTKTLQEILHPHIDTLWVFNSVVLILIIFMI
jgi:hypothetical protein